MTKHRPRQKMNPVTGKFMSIANPRKYNKTLDRVEVIIIGNRRLALEIH